MMWTYTNIKEFVEDLKKQEIKKVFVSLEEIQLNETTTGFYIIAFGVIDGVPSRFVKVVSYCNHFKEEEVKEARKKAETVFSQLKEDLKKQGLEVREGAIDFTE